MALPTITAVYRLAMPPKLNVVTLANGEKNVPVLRLRLAASSARYDKYRGEWTTAARLFIDAELFDRNATDLYDALSTGSVVTVAGELVTDEWIAKTGEPRSKIKIKAHRVFAHGPVASQARADAATK